MRIKISKSRNDRRSEHNLCNCVKKPEKFFFSGFFTQLHKFRSLRRSFLHFRSSWFMSYIIDNKNIIINSSALNSFATEVWGNSKMAWWLLHKWRDGWLLFILIKCTFLTSLAHISQASPGCPILSLKKRCMSGLSHTCIVLLQNPHSDWLTDSYYQLLGWD